MKKVALVFVMAVLVPSLVLAWLAVRSLRDQQFLIERQQALLCQRVTDALAAGVNGRLTAMQQEFAGQVEALTTGKNARMVGAQFDGQIRQNWPLAEVGFCVTLGGKILSPSANARSEAQTFYLDNGAFLNNREAAEVYNNIVPAANSAANFSRDSTSQELALNSMADSSFKSAAPAATAVAPPAALPVQQKQEPVLARAPGAANSKLKSEGAIQSAATEAAPVLPAPSSLNSRSQQTRKVNPQSVSFEQSKDSPVDEQKYLSKVVPAEAEFRQLVGEGSDGMLARFLQNKLKLMFWHRAGHEPDLIFGAQLNLNRVVNGLRDLVQAEPAMCEEICLALLDDNARPMVVSRAGFSTNWKRPFVATEIGDALPHWEIAAYLVNPAQFTQAAQTAKLTLGLFVGLLLLAIGVGSWLIVSNLNVELKLARQKTDFVSNVSHELKTPLTSIRMFSELLADGRVTDVAKQHSYLNIIAAEAARLTRLINNVLDFSRLESGEKKYQFQPCDLTELVRQTAETFRPHLESGGFKLECTLPSAPVSARGDADAIAQVIVNLLSNAEKYANGSKIITLELTAQQNPLPYAEIRVLDRGAGVPRGCGEKIFEKFYRAHDSLSSGVQGSGLGLTIARQIARAHGGDVVYEPRAGGGSCFSLRLPTSTPAEAR